MHACCIGFFGEDMPMKEDMRDMVNQAVALWPELQERAREKFENSTSPEGCGSSPRFAVGQNVEYKTFSGVTIRAFDARRQEYTLDIPGVGSETVPAAELELNSPPADSEAPDVRSTSAPAPVLAAPVGP